jgi:predicted ester cyclase
MPPSGTAVTMPFIIIYRIANSKIAEHWMVADQLGLMQQLGALPVPA